MYKKKASYVIPSDPIIHVKTIKTESEPVSSVNLDYSKPQSTQQPAVFTIIFSGGTKTEKNYFNPILKHPENFPSLKLKFEADDILLKNHNPRVFSTAYAVQDRYAKSKVKEKPDKYYIVTDVDLFMPFIQSNKPICETRGITLVVSNPCFEVWNYYSKYTDKFTEFVMPTDSEKLSHELKIYVHTRTEPQIKEKIVLYDLVNNISNSKANYAEDSLGIPALFSTNMHILGEDILCHVEKILNKP